MQGGEPDKLADLLNSIERGLNENRKTKHDLEKTIMTLAALSITRRPALLLRLLWIAGPHSKFPPLYILIVFAAFFIAHDKYYWGSEISLPAGELSMLIPYLPLAAIVILGVGTILFALRGSKPR
jgi:hypothetical protein